MFTDMDTSKTLSTTFKEAKKSPLEMTTQVLSSGFWSLSQNYTFNIPKVLETRISDYSKFYSEKYQGRKLTWLLNHSWGELYFRAASRKFLFTVTTAQMVVLLKFNDVDVLTRPQLQRELDIPAEVLNSVLASLVKADLLKLPSRTTFSSALPGDTSFALNQKFISKKVKMDLSKLQMAARSEVEVKKEQSEMERDLEKDREFVIQATIVRVMKMRKRVQHTSLITEVLAGFPPLQAEGRDGEEMRRHPHRERLPEARRRLQGLLRVHLLKRLQEMLK
ncbi:hypothetical protein L596_013167 [Steinernema carpocapsae]|uniref:Cullin family profile domain-containing protein n=1 Tax=Steinernema carpocapsae TaxID=34508 RepID=A0A4U5P065_STECR|nr:hypothetical protein L596_013167 [Steinernema carpocapsae]